MHNLEDSNLQPDFSHVVQLGGLQYMYTLTLNVKKYFTPVALEPATLRLLSQMLYQLSYLGGLILQVFKVNYPRGYQ